MLIWRLALGAVFIGGIVTLVWADDRAAVPGTWLVPLATVLALLGTGELLGMMRLNGLRPVALPIYAGNFAMVASNAIAPFTSAPEVACPFAAPAIAFALAVLAVFLAEMIRYREPGHSTIQLATAVLVLVYIGWLLTFLAQLRLAGGSETGIAALATLVLVVKLCDTGAYTVGRLLGRHKMTPRLSGGKTWEGLAGGLFFACIGSWCAFTWLLPRMTEAQRAAPRPYAWLIYGLVVGLAGVLGDLAESLLKRDLGCKDSSTWMPGFGGVLDLLDSLLFAAPVAYLTWRWLVLV